MGWGVYLGCLHHCSDEWTSAGVDWTQPACWIDEQRIAVWGAADWDDEAGEEAKRGSGVRILDVKEGKLVTDSWWPLLSVEKAAALFSDGTRLYVADARGTTVWDIGTRKRLADYPGFVAQLFDRMRNTLLAFNGQKIQVVAVSW